MNNIDKVSIELKPGVYNQFRNLNNKVWFAISEFVDNAVQSYLNNKNRLLKSHCEYQFRVVITVDWEKKEMSIWDNAAGIDSKNFTRAFEPANIPINNTGLNEFGMGMKTAAIWLADKWTVYSKALDEELERSIEFDLHRVIQEEKENLSVTSIPKNTEEHYTEIKLSNLSKNAPTLMQMDKIRKHLSSIYRKFIRTGELQIIVNNETLSYNTPEVLFAPFFKNPDGEDILWKKEIEFQAGKYKASGFIGILKTMSTGVDNGLSLFRRGRVILGSHDEKYRPKVLCGQTGSPRYKRIFGELELEGFDVSFNKSSFQDDADLEEFMEAIKDEISSKEFDLYNQAEYYRQKTKDDSKNIAKGIVKTLKKESQPRELTKRVQQSFRDLPKQEVDDTALPVNNSETLDTYVESFEFDNEHYTLKVDLINEPNVSDLYSLKITPDTLFKSKLVEYKINLAHPFFIRFDKFKKDGDYQPIIAIIKVLVIAEILAPHKGTKGAGNIRLIFNQYLQNL